MMYGKKNIDSPIERKELSASGAGSLVWEDNDFNFFTIIGGEEVFIGRGLNVPYPLEEGDRWSLPDGRAFVFENGAVSRVKESGGVFALKERLEDLYGKYEQSYLYSDPLGFVHKFDKPEDIETAGFIAAGFAFGGVPLILKTLDRIAALVDNKFYDFTVNFDPSKGLKLFKGFYYRFIKEKDIAALFLILREILRKYGSIEDFFIEGFNPADLNVKKALSSFSEKALKITDFTSIYGSPAPPQDSMVHFFFTSPEGNSPCKRLNLYLRWMVRNSDELDFGIWNKAVQPYHLVMPVDTHVARISRYIGLTSRKNPSFGMAEEITDNLKKLDYYDPIKYDFAIARLGILDFCEKEKNKNGVNCDGCDISDICAQSKKLKPNKLIKPI